MAIVLILVNINQYGTKNSKVVGGGGGGGGGVMYNCIITNTENSLRCLIFLWN